MRTMHDAVYAANIPTDATMVAGYLDANYAWSAADWARFPHATKVEITVYPWTNAGHVIDIEPGNWEPPSAPDWCRMRRAAGVTPTVYTMRSWWQWCLDEFDRQGEPQPSYWIADWDGHAAVPSGAVAKQYVNGAMINAGYDLSAVADYWPGVDNEENTMPSAKEIVDELLTRDAFTTPWDSTSGNETWTFKNVQESQWAIGYRTENAVAGLVAAVAALSDDSTLTADRVEQIVRGAVEQNIQITGTVTVTGEEQT